MENDLDAEMKKIKEEKQLVFEFGDYDKNWQKKRFSPLYLPTCGIKNQIHMMDLKEFSDEWDRFCKN